MIQITLDDRSLQEALKRIGKAGGVLTPLMQNVGEHLTESTKQRFATSSAPDGSPWEPNSEVTITRFLGKFKSSFGKSGKLTKSGANRAVGKRPLIGESGPGSLANTIHYQAGQDWVEIGSAKVYSAVQQFGALSHSFTGGKSPWGDIPARPFLGLSPDDTSTLVEIAMRHLADAISTT